MPWSGWEGPSESGHRSDLSTPAGRILRAPLSKIRRGRDVYWFGLGFDTASTI